MIRPRGLRDVLWGLQLFTRIMQKFLEYYEIYYISFDETKLQIKYEAIASSCEDIWQRNFIAHLSLNTQVSFNFIQVNYHLIVCFTTNAKFVAK